MQGFLATVVDYEFEVKDDFKYICKKKFFQNIWDVMLWNVEETLLTSPW